MKYFSELINLKHDLSRNLSNYYVPRQRIYMSMFKLMFKSLENR